MTVILCAINSETGEVLNRDGSVAGKVVPSKCSQEAFESAVRYAVDADEPAKKFWPQIYAAMLAASTVDLSGCGMSEGRVLWDDDSFCSSCGHDRDSSSVSSVDCGNDIHSCQKCGAKWREITATIDQMPQVKK